MNHYKRRQGKVLIWFLLGTNEQIRAEGFKSVNQAKRANRGNLQPNLS